MDIEARIKKIYEIPGIKIKALATIVIDNTIEINDIKIMENEKELYLIYPNRKNKNNEPVKIVNIKTYAMNNYITEKVIREYKTQREVAEQFNTIIRSANK